MKNSIYAIENVNTIPTPSLVVYRDIVKSNIKSLITITGVNKLRPHVKTCKTGAVIQLMMERGIEKFKCATIAEGEMLGMYNAKDVLLAYQPVGVNVGRLKNLINKFTATKYHCLVDNMVSANELNDYFKRDQLSVFIDVNVGMNRTGVSINKLLDFIESVSYFKNILIQGLHIYEGHIEDEDQSVRFSKAKLILDLTLSVKSKAEKLLKKNLDLVIGGTPTFPYYVASNENLQCSPGTFVFWDSGYSVFKDLPFQPAALLITRVVSIIDAVLVCLDLGHKAVASENPLHKRVRFLNEPSAELISHSEEHLVVKIKDSSKYQIGDVWYGLPWHICPTVALHQELQVVEDGFIEKQWQVEARNRKISI
jgi:D-serine deaminase-like pyridoxal phosphate-dependent protein